MMDRAHQVMRRYTRALCNAVASGDEYSQEQVAMIKERLSSKEFPLDIVESVESFVKEATPLTDDDLIWETNLLIQNTSLGAFKVPLIQEMYRIAAINDFPESQVYTISLIAVGVGVPLTELYRIESAVEFESWKRAEAQRRLGGTTQAA